jgi:hypothetical protein
MLSWQTPNNDINPNPFKHYPIYIIERSNSNLGTLISHYLCAQWFGQPSSVFLLLPLPCHTDTVALMNKSNLLIPPSPNPFDLSWLGCNVNDLGRRGRKDSVVGLWCDYLLPACRDIEQTHNYSAQHRWQCFGYGLGLYLEVFPCCWSLGIYGWWGWVVSFLGCHNV